MGKKFKQLSKDDVMPAVGGIVNFGLNTAMQFADNNVKDRYNSFRNDLNNFTYNPYGYGSYDNITNTATNVGTMSNDMTYDNLAPTGMEGLASVGSSALSGVQAGAAFGPYGALIGGAVGGVLGAGRTIRDAVQAKQIERDAANEVMYANSVNSENITNNSVKTRNKMFNNPLAYGGPTGLFTGEFSNNVITVNNGGTHEENDLGGVPFNMTEEGIPNLVEEGEVIYNNYVFSNRLKATEKDLLGFLDKKYKKKTFADIAKDLQKESSERPNDPISRQGLEDSMSKLMSIQEKVKARKGVNTNGINGNTFAPGGNTKPSFLKSFNAAPTSSYTVGSSTLPNTQKTLGNLSLPNIQLGGVNVFRTSGITSPYTVQKSSIDNTRPAGLPDFMPTSIVDPSQYSRPTSPYTMPKFNGDILLEQANTQFKPVDVQLDNEPIDIYNADKELNDEFDVAFNNNQYNAALTNKSNRPVPTIEQGISNVYDKMYGSPEDRDAPRRQILKDAVATAETNSANQRAALAAENAHETSDVIKDNFLRYAPAINNAAILLNNVFEKPDYTNARRIDAAARAIPTGSYTPIGGYVNIKDADTANAINEINRQRLSAQRAMANSGLTAGQAQNAILASNAQNALGLSRIMASNNEINAGNLMREYQANSAIDRANAESAARAAAQDQARAQAIYNAANQSSAMMNAIDAAKAASISNASSAVATDFGAIGRERTDRDTLSKLIESGALQWVKEPTTTTTPAATTTPQNTKTKGKKSSKKTNKSGK